MNILLSELAMLFVLVVISDGLAAFGAARSCWRVRRRASLAWPLTIFMASLALVDLSDVINIAVNGVRNPGGVGYWQALVGRVVRSAATWYLALKLMNGYSSANEEEEVTNDEFIDC